MSNLLDPDNDVSKERLLTAICLIMLIEHQKLGLEEVINATGMKFDEIRSALQNLVNLRLVKVLPTQSGIPCFQIIDQEEAREYLNVIGVSQDQL